MNLKYNDRIEVIKGFHRGRTGKVVGKFLFWTEVLFDEQFAMTDTIRTKKLRRINKDDIIN